jgi:hypothetical protein
LAGILPPDVRAENIKVIAVVVQVAPVPNPWAGLGRVQEQYAALPVRTLGLGVWTVAQKVPEQQGNCDKEYDQDGKGQYDKTP